MAKIILEEDDLFEAIFLYVQTKYGTIAHKGTLDIDEDEKFFAEIEVAN